MTASETPDAVQPVIPEEVVAVAWVAREAWEVDDLDSRDLVTVILTAAYPVLRSVIEAELREQIAREIEALRDAHFQEYGNEEPSARGEDWGYTRAARVARGVGASHKREQR